MTSSIVTPGVVWAERACADDPELFYPSHITQIHAAQRVCASCPMLAACAQLAQQMKPSNCVVASVWVQDPHGNPAAVDRARRELAVVAVTGKPVPLADPRRAPQDRSQRWADPQFRAQVVELWQAGRSWQRIANGMKCSIDIARKAYEIETGTKPGRRRAARKPAPTRKSAAVLDFQVRVVQLRDGEDKSWRRIAAELGCAAQTAQVAYERLLAQAV